MLYLGEHLTAAAGTLRPISEEQLLARIVSPSEEFKSQIVQLRTIRTLDAKRYSELKRNLPYFVCGKFDPPVRRTENFAHCSSFVLDIDHISDKGLDKAQLRQTLLADTRVMLCYTSPSEDGFKLLFRLAEPCYDKGIFSVFYHAFAEAFARQYAIEQVVDARTCDVTRACFLSYDPDAHYNPLAEAVDINAYINPNDSISMFDQKHAAERAQSAAEQEQPNAEPTHAEPTDESLQKIKEVLGLYRARKEPTVVFVPEQLNAVMTGLQDFFATLDIVVNEVSDINYGKKIKVSLGIKKAECNLFYGKRGFTAVQSPRTGTDHELNAMLQELLYAYLATL